MGGSKVKVYCKECMRQNIAKVQADDQIEVEQGIRAGGVRSTEVITEYLWTLNMQVDKTRGYLNSRSDTLLVHLKHCPYQPESVRDRAVRELELRKPARGGPPKHGHSGTHTSTSQPPSSSASPLPGFPPLPADWPPPSPSPLAHTRSASRPPSLGPLRSRHSSRGFHPYHSPSPASPALGPEQWTAARQSLFESYMIRLTASAGLPFSWIENPVWLSFCDEFLPSAKVPSRTTLSRRLLRDEVKLFRTQAVKRTAGANATLQADGWTGINNHHLVAFMLTGKREVHAVRVIDTSSERKTADKFLKHIEDVLNETSKEWKVKIIAFTSDASGESRAARIRLLSRYPYLIILDCYAHQINLIVGDYLECKSLLLDVADDAEELITWLRKRTLAKARRMMELMNNGTFWHSLTR
ncbi:hypothetical protein FKP32DRAFT_1728495 [Trametes sanguinea]|nr:hypothetical protein FKP32DRAFT_1728495 [Trametes sanguinea]